jgi:rRNA biogenesis protein RRP5
VRSVEDHGYVIDFGIEGKSGFLLKKNAAEFVHSWYKGRSLCVGQVVRCVVLSGPDTRTVPVSVNPSDVDVAMMSASDHIIGIGSLLPGLLVKAAVKEVSCVTLCHMNIVASKVEL